MTQPTPYPLAWPDGWPRTPQRKTSMFRTGYLPAWKNLQAELRRLGATDVVVSTNVPCKRNGEPYADGMNDDILDPGVVVYFNLPDGPRHMARDGHPTPAENLHAIGHVIEALRSIDRHGGSYMMKRAFSAFAALPAPDAARPWRQVLGIPLGFTITAAALRGLFRDLAQERHPDKGGTPEQMTELIAARDAALREIGGDA